MKLVRGAGVLMLLVLGTAGVGAQTSATRRALPDAEARSGTALHTHDGRAAFEAAECALYGPLLCGPGARRDVARAEQLARIALAAHVDGAARLLHEVEQAKLDAAGCH
jgi:hypothetical protein